MNDHAELREKFQHARRSVLCANLMSALQNSRECSPVVGDIIRKLEIAAGYRAAVPLVNQTLFLQVAYVMLLWLHEAFKKEGLDDRLRMEVDFDFAKIKVICAGGRMAEDEQRHPSGSDKLIPLRHAIAHAAVEVTDDTFRFTNKDPRDPASFVVLEMEWHALEELCRAVMLAASRILYPD